MKKNILYIVSLYFLSLIFVSCNNNNNSERITKLVQEYDSLLLVNKMQQNVIEDMTYSLAQLSSSLDTINVLERMIQLRVDEDGKPLSKQGLREKIIFLQEYLKNQKQKMTEMEETIASDNRLMNSFKTIIAFMNESLTQKDREINGLQAELASRNYYAKGLEDRIVNLDDSVTTLANDNISKNRLIDEQDLSMNEVYYVIGEKKQLIDWGIITKSGIPFKASKINYESIDKTVLNKADRRHLTSIAVCAKDIKIISEVPKNSYKIEGKSKNYRVCILDREKFWSANNKLLVIQIKE